MPSARPVLDRRGNRCNLAFRRQWHHCCHCRCSDGGQSSQRPASGRAGGSPMLPLLRSPLLPLMEASLPFAWRIALSYDGGKTFPVQNRLVTELMTADALANPLPGASFFPGHILSSITIAADGTFYDVWGRRSAGHTVVMLTKSTSGGLTWSTPVVAGDVPGRSDIFQAEAVSPRGVVNVVFDALDDVAQGTPPWVPTTSLFPDRRLLRG